MLDVSAATRLQERPQVGGPFALHDLLNAVFYHRRAVAIVAAAVVAIGVLVAILMPPTYRAEARLLPLSAGVYDTQANGAVSPTQALAPLDVANVELQLLSSLEIHRAVVRRQLGPNATAADVNAALGKFESHLHVTKANDANVIELSYTARDPDAAAAALRQLLAAYFENRATVLTSGRVAFLVNQRDQVKMQLDAANARIAAYQQQNQVVDVAAQLAGAVQQDDLLRQQKMASDAALADGRQSVATLQAGARAVPAEVELYSDNSEAARAIGEMQASALQLQGKRADLVSRYMASAPIVGQIDKQITALQTAIAQQKDSLVTTRRTGRNQYYDSSRDRLTQTEATLAGEAARRRILDDQIAASGERLQHLKTVSETIGRMMLDRDVLADTFKSLSGQVEQARVQLNQASGAGSPSVRIIEAPTAPTQRSNPPALLIAGSLLAAVLIAGAALLVLASLRDTLLSPQEVERLVSLPVLAAPESRDPADEASRRDYGQLVAAIDNGGPAGKTILLLAPRSRASLQAAALALGTALHRRAPGRVLLIRFAEGAPVPADAAGMAIAPIDGIASGVIGTDASSRRLDARLLAELGAMYDYLIVTAPPTATSFESVELSRAADMLLVVIEAERTRRPALREMIAQVDQVGGRIFGAILLGRRQHIPRPLHRLLVDRTPTA